MMAANKEKAMTERVIYREASRERDSWWKSLMWKGNENHSRAAMYKVREISRDE